MRMWLVNTTGAAAAAASITKKSTRTASSVTRNYSVLCYWLNQRQHQQFGRSLSSIKNCEQVFQHNNTNNGLFLGGPKHQFQLQRYIHIERRLTELGIILPPAPTPRANYNIACHAAGNMLYISGHLPFTPEGVLCTGRVGPTTSPTSSSSTVDAVAEEIRSLEYGYQAARHAGLNIIATLQSQLDGDLDRVEQIVKLLGIVNSTTDFVQQHLVMDGCSDVIMQVFGPQVGYHARSAIGTNTLPLNTTIEVEAIVQIKSKH